MRKTLLLALLLLPAWAAQAQTAAPPQFYPWSTLQNKCRNPPSEDGRMACRQQVAQDREKDWNDSQNLSDHIISAWREYPQFLDRAFNDIAVEEPRFKNGQEAGEWKMPVALVWLENEFAIDWEKNLAKIVAWEAAAPRSPYPYVLEALYWKRYAWDARGNGYANTVTKDAWALFGERLAMADAALEKARPFGINTPAWHEMKMQVAYARNAPEAQKLFTEATRRFPEYYKFYETALSYSLPRWGGSPDSIERLVRESIRITRPTLGTTMYARLYTLVANDRDVGAELFTKTRANWPEMKASIAELMQRQPQAHHASQMAQYACIARDREATLAALDKMREQGLTPKWPGPVSSDSCIAWANKLPAT